jgi:hypothetical protein
MHVSDGNTDLGSTSNIAGGPDGIQEAWNRDPSRLEHNVGYARLGQ